MNIKIKKVNFQKWILENKYENLEIHILFEKYYNDVLSIGILNSYVTTIQEAENSKLHDIGMPISDIVLEAGMNFLNSQKVQQ